MNRGAIILCGGRSERMGCDKAALLFGRGETMLARVVRLVAEVVSPDRIVCVAATGQELSPLPAGVQVVRDARPHEGPLAGLAGGLAAMRGTAEAVYVTGGDMPLVVPAFVERVFELWETDRTPEPSPNPSLAGRGMMFEIAAPHDGERWHPLSAVYRTDVESQVLALLADGERSLMALLEACRTRRVPVDALREVDPTLATLVSCNTPAEYKGALAIAGIK